MISGAEPGIYFFDRYLMGLNKEDKETISYLEQRRIVETRTACFWSVLVSVVGGLMLGWWEYQYHPANKQLWMVPFGLVLFATPAIVWFSVVASDICNPNNHYVLRVSQPVHLNDSVVPAKKDEQWSNHVDRV
ncbi:hypothetical protein ACFX15_000867 [Malus domestica]